MLQQVADALILPVFIQGTAPQVQPELHGMQMGLGAAKDIHPVGQQMFMDGRHRSFLLGCCHANIIEEKAAERNLRKKKRQEKF